MNYSEEDLNPLAIFHGKLKGYPFTIWGAPPEKDKVQVPFSHRCTVPQALSAVPLFRKDYLASQVIITALEDNTSIVTVGDLGTSAALNSIMGYPLYPAGSICLYNCYLSEIGIDARVAGEGVSFFAMVNK